MNFKDYVKKPKNKSASASKVLPEDYENPYRFDWGTPAGTKYMQKMTPNKPTECVTPGEVWSEKQGKCVPIREAYFNEEIFKLNEIVEASNGDKGPIVFRGSSYVTLKLNDGTSVKHWLKNIKESSGKFVDEKTTETVILNKRKINEKKIPALLMSRQQLKEMNKEQLEISYMGYDTEYLHMCPSASELLNKLIGIEKLNPKYVLQAIQATDQYLAIEKIAIDRGFADEQLIHDFTMKFAIAHDTLNMFYIPDKDLMFMQDHLKTMSDLSMHRDGTFANETGTTATVYGTSMEEEFKEKKPMNKYHKMRRKIQELYEPDPPTHNRDINFSDNKDVFHGIDNPIDSEHGPDKKPVGMVSFKTFMNDPMNKKVAAQHDKDRQDVHRAQVEMGKNPSSAYPQMKKAALRVEP
jgi:hypothetical protein